MPIKLKYIYDILEKKESYIDTDVVASTVIKEGPALKSADPEASSTTLAPIEEETQGDTYKLRSFEEESDPMEKKGWFLLSSLQS